MLLPLLAALGSLLSVSQVSAAHNKTYNNPILPGFHPDPSCTLVPEWDNTFFCATSSFNAIPGVPIFASKDLQNFRQIGNVLTRESRECQFTTRRKLMLEFVPEHLVTVRTAWARYYQRLDKWDLGSHYPLPRWLALGRHHTCLRQPDRK